MKLIFLKMLGPDQMPVLNVVKWDIFSVIVNTMETNFLITKHQDRQHYDSYDPVVGKWMTNLVATTPITAKAMQSLLVELNRQKELKRTYSCQYKDLQTVTTTTNSSVMLQLLLSTAHTKTSANSSPIKHP